MGSALKTFGLDTDAGYRRVRFKIIRIVVGPQ